MHFKHPEILYALFALIIPIIIHLFQFQKFQKVEFTNVKLLKSIEQKTRKSSKLKEWLILISRLLILSSIILAFSQPYFGKNEIEKSKDTFIYVDNSMSMSASNELGELFASSIEELSSIYNKDESNIILITNNQLINNYQFKNSSNDLDYTSANKDLKTLALEIENQKSDNLKNIILISDFQHKTIDDFELFLNDTMNEISLIQTLPNERENIMIDSIWISNQENENLQLSVKIQNHGSTEKETATSLFIENELIGKSNPLVPPGSSKTINFELTKTDATSGKVVVNDNFLIFDNIKYFNLPEKIKPKILVIENEPSFINHIFNEEEFEYISINTSEINSEEIFNQDLIILNELNKIPFGLLNNLKIFVENGGNITFVLPNDMDESSYQKLAFDFGLGQITLQNKKHYITDINYSNPFFKNVFKEQVKNFQYPFTDLHYSVTNKGINILSFDNGNHFVSNYRFGEGNLFLISSPINKLNSNFTASPLIVPIFINFSNQNKALEQLYYEIGKDNKIVIKEQVNREDVIHLTNNQLNYNHIPLQIIKTNEFEIRTTDSPDKSGIYQVNNNGAHLKNLAFNYQSESSRLNYFPVESLNEYGNINIYENVKDGITAINEQNKSKELWQLFVIFALVFLGVEMLILKFFKNQQF